MTIKVGTAVGEKGKITRGEIKIIDHPTGGVETLPVIIATGEDGPTLLITANIHGNEVVGVVIIHRLLEQLNLKELQGTIVCIPSLNPTGQRELTRFPRFDLADPNRKWPDSKPKKDDLKDETDWLDKYYKDDDPTIQERIWENVYKIFIEIKPNYHIDLHTFSVLSIPFIFLDRILYDEDEMEAQALSIQLQDMVGSFGLTTIVEAPAKRYVKDKLHRSTSGFTLNKMRIPSCTIELGPMNVADPLMRDAGIKAIKNMMRWAKMIASDFEPIMEVTVISTKEPHRYISYPYNTKSGVVDLMKNPGDAFGEGDTLAVIRSITGELIEEIKAEFDGFVMGWWNGIAKYPHTSLGMVAVKDKMPMVVKWSDIKKN